jgi:probable HAF family extracellular repeat protein
VSNNNQILVNVGDEPQIWDIRTTPMTVTSLGKLNGNPTTARDINDAGDVVGSARFNGPSSHAFLWTAKKGMVELIGSGGDLDASSINNAGQIVGTDYGTGSAHAALWSKGKFYDLGVLAGYSSSSGVAINTSGQIVGSSSATSALRTTVWSLK